MSEAIIFHCDVEICGSKIKKGTFVRQKEWVGLTEEELEGLSQEQIMVAIAAEAALKEKNHG